MYVNKKSFKAKLLFISIYVFVLFMIGFDVIKADTQNISATDQATVTSYQIQSSADNGNNEEINYFESNQDQGTSDVSRQESSQIATELQTDPPTPRLALAPIQWGNSQLAFDQTTGVVTINGGLVNNPLPISRVLQQERNNIKSIKITAPLTITGSASYLFASLPNLTTIEGLNLVDTTAITDMSDMFNNCRNLTSLKIQSFNTAQVTNMGGMFNGCESLAKLDLASFNTAQVKNMRWMFHNCYSLKQLDLSHFDTSNTETMEIMFNSCKSLTKLDLSNFNTAKVTSMMAMFDNCASLVELNIRNFNTKQVTDKSWMLGLPKLKIIHLGTEITDLQRTYFSTTGGKWANVGRGTINSPESSKVFAAADLEQNYHGEKDADTYVRLDSDVVIRVKYVDENNQALAPDDILTGKLGENYVTTPKNIAQYYLKYQPSNAQGKFGIFEQEVIYVYSLLKDSGTSRPPLKGADIIIHYQDAQGNTIASDEILHGNVGDGYISMSKEIAGYQLKTRPDNATGFFTDQPQVVIYVYTKSTTSDSPQSGASIIEKSKNTDPDLGHYEIACPVNKAKKQLAIKVNHLARPTNSRHLHPAAPNNSLPQTGTNQKLANLYFLLGGILLLASFGGVVWHLAKQF
ncbi:BspA family leucine-rich repeat surface protein [Lactobacillus sp. ESL0236]|uniref:BspA family leucine-rich repeat surface protein n=1 Tax=unclassified Lactobacillus TaxID=2620435 RepID=UPI000EFBF812|nr:MULTISPECIES: BspA family leucine-rich repeat surface protein [unclassified Lactobacillus]RMC40793.1 BspA family leucine-rich repeat surface protein [Lactobacillus sp. ESL0237]RMC44549.1 BspA family leucine-rich repeat surface protein [Lactobacillus sp. ESL0234]RMC45856.1 BspA family leucine-rich repeat surface protein [Lactobacillus sp. ESL0236]